MPQTGYQNPTTGHSSTASSIYLSASQVSPLKSAVMLSSYIFFVFLFCFSHGTTARTGSGPSHCPGFTITLRRSKLGSTPTDERSARPRNLCGLSIARIAGSNPAESVDVRLLCLLCRYRPLRRADHSYRGGLLCVCVCVCLIVCDTET